MTIDKSTTSKTRSIRLKVIKATWETLTIKEKLPDYLINNRKITSSSEVYQLFRYLGIEAKEHFLALHLDAKNKIICVDQVSVGSLTASIVQPREVMKSCMLSSCAGLVLVHNHPSEDPSPSREDIEITKRLKECCDLLGVRLLDHVVIGSDEYVSLADRGGIMSVYKRGKVFYMNFTVNGVRVFRSTGMTTKREAKRVEATERHRLLKGSRQSPQEKSANTLLQEAIELTYQAKWKYGKDSKRSYRRACNLADLIGNLPLKEIDEATVVQLTRKLENRKSSTATINRYLACLKTILKHMKQPADFISLRKERKGRIRVLSKEEERQVIDLLRYADHSLRRAYFPEVADLVEVLVDTGLRLGEALNLRYEDIDFNSNLISIWINKGDRPRSVPMTSRVRNVLEARQSSNQEKPFTIKAHQAETAWRWLRKEMGKEADKEFVIHSLRHTTASRMVNAGVDLYVVKDILGHASIATTQIYAHLAPHKLAQAISILEG